MSDRLPTHVRDALMAEVENLSEDARSNIRRAEADAQSFHGPTWERRRVTRGDRVTVEAYQVQGEDRLSLILREGLRQLFASIDATDEREAREHYADVAADAEAIAKGLFDDAPPIP